MLSMVKIIYKRKNGFYFIQNRTNVRRPHGACPGQKKIERFFPHFLHIVRLPQKLITVLLKHKRRLYDIL